MPLQVDAVQENGVLRPLQLLDLREHEHVVVTILEAALAESNGKVAGLNGAAAKLGIPRSTHNLR